MYIKELINVRDKQLKQELKKLKRLSPFLDSDGMLCVHSRLSKTNMTYSQSHQIILPRRHKFTKLVIQYYHERVWHSGPIATLSISRTAYWITSGIATVRFYLKMCVRCIRHNARPNLQLLDDVPYVRVAVHQPAFKDTGVDYYGPFTVSTGIRGYNKKVC